MEILIILLSLIFERYKIGRNPSKQQGIAAFLLFREMHNEPVMEILVSQGI